MWPSIHGNEVYEYVLLEDIDVKCHMVDNNKADNLEPAQCTNHKNTAGVFIEGAAGTNFLEYIALLEAFGLGGTS